MPRRTKNPAVRVPTKCSPQISESHCGPAVVQMLLGNLGIEVSQEAITEAAGAADSIDEQGTRVDQLAQAVRALAPDVQFWVKENARIGDLVKVLNEHRFAVGVEWQGLFESPDEILDDDDDEDDENDYGHYSVVSYIDQATKQLIIVDPYKDFVDQDRVFPISVFRRRWWDTNEVTDPETGDTYLVEDNRLMFIITPIMETFPESLGMKRL